MIVLRLESVLLMALGHFGARGVHSVGDIPVHVLDAVFADISVHLPLVDSTIDWRDWERAWAYAVVGDRLGSNKRLVDVVSGDVFWSVKSLGSGISSSDRVSAVSSRLDVRKHRGVEDLLADVNVTGCSALDMWNEKIAWEHARYSRGALTPGKLDLRLLVIALVTLTKDYVFHERQLLQEDIGSYKWRKNPSGNVEGYVGNRHCATFLLNGFKLTMYYDLQRTDPRVRYYPPIPMSVEQAREFRKYDPIRIHRQDPVAKQLKLFSGESDDG